MENDTPMIEPQRLSVRNGVELYAQWTRARVGEHGPDGQTKANAATVLITHGLGEHSGRYGHVVEKLAESGCDVLTYDLRGHGRSGGRRGDAPSFHAFLDDLGAVAASAREASAAPLFLYGHSLGGLITLRFLEEFRDSGTRRIEGAIIASPWLRLTFQPPRWKLLLAEVARRVWPGLCQLTGLDDSRLSRDPAFLATMPDLDLTHHRLSARLFYTIGQACVAARDLASEIRLPLLLLHGQADPVTSWEATRGLFETAGSADKTLLLYPETFHETHNDLDRDRVLADIVSWLRQRATPIPTPATTTPPGPPSGP